LKRRLITVVGLLVVCLFSGGCIPAGDFDANLNSIVRPYSFSIVGWESTAIPCEIGRFLFARDEKVDDEASVVTEYFLLVNQIKALESEIRVITLEGGQDDTDSLEAELSGLQQQKVALGDTVEGILENQIREVLAEQGIFNPADIYTGMRVTFPPVNFTLEKPPYLLVISPRDRIETVRDITLQQNIDLEVMEDIEARVDQLGVSSLVVGLGGLGSTYPTFVADNASLRFTIDTATEEWLHQYLAFKPLGFSYALHLIGISKDYEIATINETLASMVSKEIGTMICEKYYPEYEWISNYNQVDGSEFDFNEEMREIRRTVDGYLAQGEVEQAEEFMEQKRQYLAENGYYIRKLNQAYFAFYGAYADRPTSISPIGVELKELRTRSASLKNFLEVVAGMTSYQELTEYSQ